MDWAIIIQLVIDLIRQCMDNRSEEQIAEGLRNPGLREVFALRRILRSSGMRGKTLTRNVSRGIQELCQMGEDERAAIMAEAAGDE